MADEELKRVRVQFVKRVSEVVISQLLDDMLQENVLNDEERDSIDKSILERAEKARRLIDTVKRKGSTASEKLIASLESNDKTLFSVLGLSCAPPPQPAAAAPKEQGWSMTQIPPTATALKEKLNDKSIYPVTEESIGNRMALLITNIKFTNEKLNRNGAEKDEENMEKLLKSLKYEVVKHTNLTGQQIDKAVSDFSKHPKLKDTDSVLVVIMSHGKLGAILGVDCKDETAGGEKPDEFPINNIYKHLGSGNCPALLDKPKIIIIQACRGGENGSVLVSVDANAALPCDDVNQPGPSPSEDNIEADTLKYVHKEKDFISLLSCTPDTVSYRDPNSGSFLIQYFVKVLEEYAHQDDINELFRKVMQRFESFAKKDKRQMATVERNTLLYRFYFIPRS